MGTTDLVIDTSVFIEYLRAADKKKTVLFRLAESKKMSLSAISHYELLMGANTANKKMDIQLVIQDLPIIPFDEFVTAHAAEIYHHLKKINQLIDFRDLFIAATCIAYKLPLKTLNTKHFARISNLELE